MKRLSLFLLPLFVSALPAVADDFAPTLEAYLTSDIAGWANDPVLVAAIVAQNAGTAGYDQARIDSLDQDWKDSVGAGGSELISGVLQNPAADFLRGKVEAAGGKITEVFITDARGLNVAATDATSDYWQGDEDKFAKVFPAPDGKFIAEVELDESTQRYQGQVSMTVVDPATGQAVGTLTVGVDAESLM
ncbi:hypothetical protein LHP98_03095 [Rhodobacter sp. Har01]|uniref:hypothetical protein n=1 Tax=Rhodobacter sp. Har01 TaxID=2883999 RepID=UPI001D069C41|nr:hypothetical protein [Rhodobacter sp. Har01]MCB6177115.1 hypothetical protein [Rhodobacter sp. Har01]